jgi:hypothetical protein
VGAQQLAPSTKRSSNSQIYKGQQMSIKLNDQAYKELKTAMRDYTTKGRVEKFLTRIQEDAYQQGYIDCYNVTNNKIKQVVANALNGVPSAGDNLDGEQLPADSGELGTGAGPNAADTDSSEGSPESEPSGHQESGPLRT